MTLDQDEQLLVDALHRTDVAAPDLSAIALKATRSGTRLRHRHQARAAVATFAVVGVGVAGAAVLAGGEDRAARGDGLIADTSKTPGPTVTLTPLPAPTPTTSSIDTSDAYAVLDAPGWTAPADNNIGDEKLYYVQDGTDASVSLNWRPSNALGPKYTIEQEQADLDARYGGETMVATTTMDGGVAHVFEDHGMFTAVGAIKHGRFLTLSAAGLSAQQLAELATHVHRQAAEHLAGDAQ